MRGLLPLLSFYQDPLSCAEPLSHCVTIWSPLSQWGLDAEDSSPSWPCSPLSFSSLKKQNIEETQLNCLNHMECRFESVIFCNFLYDNKLYNYAYKIIRIKHSQNKTAKIDISHKSCASLSFMCSCWLCKFIFNIVHCGLH